MPIQFPVAELVLFTFVTTPRSTTIRLGGRDVLLKIRPAKDNVLGVTELRIATDDPTVILPRPVSREGNDVYPYHGGSRRYIRLWGPAFSSLPLVAINNPRPDYQFGPFVRDILNLILPEYEFV